MANDLEPLSVAAASLPAPRSRVTMWRWVKANPDLAINIGSRMFIWRACREAIGKGASLTDAAAIGRRLRGRR